MLLQVAPGNAHINRATYREFRIRRDGKGADEYTALLKTTDFDLDSMGSIGVMCSWLRRISNSELVLIFHRRIDIAGSADRHHT